MPMPSLRKPGARRSTAAVAVLGCVVVLLVGAPDTASAASHTASARDTVAFGVMVTTPPDAGEADEDEQEPDGLPNTGGGAIGLALAALAAGSALRLRRS